MQFDVVQFDNECIVWCSVRLCSVLLCVLCGTAWGSAVCYCARCVVQCGVPQCNTRCVGWYSVMWCSVMLCLMHGAVLSGAV